MYSSWRWTATGRPSWGISSARVSASAEPIWNACSSRSGSQRLARLPRPETHGPHPETARAHPRADARRADDCRGGTRLPIEHINPHTWAQFASILAACDVPPGREYLMGHTDPTLTLAVYQQVLDMGRGSVQRLEDLLGCSLAEARAIYNGETVGAGVSVLNPCSDTKNPSPPSGRSAAEA